MRKLLLSGLLMLACSAWVAAQTGGGGTGGGGGGTAGTTASGPTSANTSGATGASTDTSGTQTSIKGCLSGSNGNYTLTDNMGATYQLQGKDSDLSKHVGEKIEVQGTEANAQPSDIKAGDVTSAPRTTEKTTVAGSPSGQMFNVSHVNKISGSCTNTSNTSNPKSQ